MTDYKGWQIEIQTERAPDADGWRVYVTVSITSGGSVRTVPLSFKDARVFDTEAVATEAGRGLARVWIDGQG